MSNLLAGIAPQAAVVGQSLAPNASQATRNAGGNVPQNQQIQQLIANGAVSGSAAVVSISAEAKSRVASYGQGRSVDASFDKGGKRGGPEAKEDGNKTEKENKVKVTA